MSDIAIKVEGLSKQYRIGEQERYKALRDVITDAATAPFRRLRSAFNRQTPAGNGNGNSPAAGSVLSTQHSVLGNHDSSLITHHSSLPNTIWALDDVSFEVKRGEVVGIIGRNGAGKSTLLKILSRITKPTKGHAKIHGRVGSLLEVGTGFHPELTGRENIYLNAAILGMRKAEVERKFDEIVAFAEVEKFIDTPVKRYSSGMYVRLAFAVAAHMETEVLVVDEVLAVGDALFQKKCLGKMGRAAREGRTVLFVSHDMTAVQVLCPRALILENGEIVGDGIAEDEIGAYLANTKRRGANSGANAHELGGQLTLANLNFRPNPIVSGSPCTFELELVSSTRNRLDDVALLIYTSSGKRAAVLDLRGPGVSYRLDELTPLKLSGEIKSLPLVEGDYTIGLYVNGAEVKGDYLDLLDLTISGQRNYSQSIPYPPAHRGVVELNFKVFPQADR
jgi:lipopolysaccharide transport system ATP-binding protein